MSHKHDVLRSPLSRVRGLGSAKDGTHHWWMQRLTAIVLAPLSIWFVTNMLCGAMYTSSEKVGQWFAHPLTAMGVIALLVALFFHAKLGLQVVIEDYVSCSVAKPILLILNQLFCVALGIVSVLAVVKLHLHTGAYL